MIAMTPYMPDAQGADKDKIMSKVDVTSALTGDTMPDATGRFRFTGCMES